MVAKEESDEREQREKERERESGKPVLKAVAARTICKFSKGGGRPPDACKFYASGPGSTQIKFLYSLLSPSQEQRDQYVSQFPNF